jgi:hypothetical protein
MKFKMLSGPYHGDLIKILDVDFFIQDHLIL